jgi:fumarylacetoacetase
VIEIDDTHDPRRRCWIKSANGHRNFPIQNLPLGIFSPPGGAPQGGVAIGDEILDLPAVLSAGLLHGDAALAAETTASDSLNSLLALGSGPRQALRARLSELLSDDSAQRQSRGLLHDAASCRLCLPARVGDYTDFYVGIHHATNVGKQFRPENPLLPNYKYVPIGYHGRSSSVCPSGTPVRRPNGQRKLLDEPSPRFGPSERLDYELELGIWVGPGNSLGEPIDIDRAAEHVSGYCLLNDWSARDIQAWEYQPLGPFLSKNFSTTVSPWIITPEALAPFRTPQPPRPKGDPAPLRYLWDEADQQGGALDLELEVLLLTPAMQEKRMAPHRLAASNARYMYWTVAQLIAHHTSGGCNLNPGDLLGTGTISGPDREGAGSLLELTLGGRNSVTLPSGENRGYLQDGDEVIMMARCKRDGFETIGFGECRARILPAA